jgi:hypothetical protein
MGSRSRAPRFDGIARTGLTGLLLASVLALSPGSARPVAAATTSTLQTDAAVTYTLDSAKHLVHVAIDVKVTNLKPNSGGLVYYYFGTFIGVQAEATSIKVADSKGPLTFTKKAVKASRIDDDVYFASFLLNIDFRSNIFYKQVASFRISYDMLGGPRSTTDVRVSAAAATFPVWAWGDDGRSSVKVVLPAGYVAHVLYSPMLITTSGDTTVLTSKPTDVAHGWSTIVAEREAGYVSTPLSLPGDLDVVLEAVPGDEAWATAARDTLTDGFADLQTLVGLPWQSTSPFRVRERFIPSFATVPDRRGATVLRYGLVSGVARDQANESESLAKLEILSGAATYWFNDQLFTGRWIAAGFAREYAAEVLTANGDKIEGPARPTASDSNDRRLNVWIDPPYVVSGELLGEIKDAAALEIFRVNAAWYVARELVAEVGSDKMRQVFAAAAARQIPYVGAGTPETLPHTATWKQLLDLLEEIGDSTKAEDLLKTFVLTVPEAIDLADRGAARTAYQALVDDGKGWLPPFAVRGPMADWDFKVATERMAAAKAVLDLRAQVEAAAAELGVTTGPALQDAYEAAGTDFEAATALAKAELEALAAIKAAKAGIDASRDLVATIGLIGADPAKPLADARAAYAADDLPGTLTAAASAAAVIASASGIGVQRLAIVGAVVVVLVVLFVIWRVRRGRRARPPSSDPGGLPAANASMPETMPAAAPPPPEAPLEPSATLAADPPSDGLPPALPEPVIEGGLDPEAAPGTT